MQSILNSMRFTITYSKIYQSKISTQVYLSFFYRLHNLVMRYDFNITWMGFFQNFSVAFYKTKM